MPNIPDAMTNNSQCLAFYSPYSICAGNIALKYLFVSIISIITLFTSDVNLFAQTPANDLHWELLWNDEFDSNLVSDKWNIVNNSDHNDPNNCCNELQVYTNRLTNVFISNGHLVLRAKHETYYCPAGTHGCVRQNITGQPYNYTSGELTTTPMYYPQYGYIESSITLPYGKGFWPALWTWTGVPNYQEIDIFEMIPGVTEDFCNPNVNHNEYRMTSSFHLSGNENSCDNGRISFIDDYTQPHIYGIEWSPSRIIYYVNGHPVRYAINTGLYDPTSLIINFAIPQWNPPNGSTPFPADMIIDYVRVYKLRSDFDAIINSTNYNFASYDNIEKNFIEIGNNGGNNQLQVGDDIKLRASQYINISGNFQVPIGASIYLDANKICVLDKSRECTLLFNPCVYDFDDYNNNDVNRRVELGGSSCELSIMANNHEVNLHAVEAVVLNPGVSIPPPTNSVTLNIIPCSQ